MINNKGKEIRHETAFKKRIIYETNRNNKKEQEENLLVLIESKEIDLLENSKSKENIDDMLKDNNNIGK